MLKRLDKSNFLYPALALYCLMALVLLAWLTSGDRTVDSMVLVVCAVSAAVMGFGFLLAFGPRRQDIPETRATAPADTATPPDHAQKKAHLGRSEP